MSSFKSLATLRFLHGYKSIVILPQHSADPFVLEDVSLLSFFYGHRLCNNKFKTKLKEKKRGDKMRRRFCRAYPDTENKKPKYFIKSRLHL